MSDQIQTARQSLAKARNDLLSADNNLKAERIPFDAVCFHCQQAAEKILKACLVAKGHPYPPTHSRPLPPSPKNPTTSTRRRNPQGPLAILIPYAVEVRYPDIGYMPSEQDAREARDAAEQVLRWLNQSLSELFDPFAGD